MDLRRPPPSPAALLDKARQASAIVGDMRARIDGWFEEEIARLQAREAGARAGLVEAVLTALARAARLQQVPPAPPAARMPGRLARRLHWRARWGLARLGPHAQARLIEQLGLWRAGPSGRARREIAAYLRRKADPAAQPPILLDQAWYLTRYPDVGKLGLSPLLHYLLVGQGEGRDPHPLFDTGFYTRRYADELAQDLAWALGHYIHVGAPALHDPHPLFDARRYVAQGASPEPGEDVVSHYLREGWRLGLSPHPLFDPAWYEGQGAAGAARTPPLLHYVLEGAAAGRSPHPLFEPAWYLAQAPDAGADPLRHYLEVGAAHGLSPSRWFDPQHYAARRGAALAPGANPLVDYLEGGAWDVAEPAPGFATAAYVAAHPELVGRGLTPLEHWARAATERRRAD